MDLATYAELAVRLVNTASYSEDSRDRLATLDGLHTLVADREHLSGSASRRDLDALCALRSEFRKIFSACAERHGEEVAARLNRANVTAFRARRRHSSAGAETGQSAQG